RLQPSIIATGLGGCMARGRPAFAETQAIRGGWHGAGQQGMRKHATMASPCCNGMGACAGLVRPRPGTLAGPAPADYAPVVQWIEWKFPKLLIQVRFLSGAPPAQCPALAGHFSWPCVPWPCAAPGHAGHAPDPAGLSAPDRVPA